MGYGLEEEAARNRDIAAGKAEWIFRLSNKISPLATLQSRHLLEIVDQSERFRDEVTQSINSISDLRSSIREFEAFIKAHPASPGSNEAVLAIRSLRLFADDYELWIENTAQRSLHSSPLGQIANIPETSLTSQLHRDQLALLQSELDAPQSRDLQIRLRELSEQLSLLGEGAAIQEKQALEGFLAARDFRTLMMMVGLLGSTAVAIVLAISISRAIARPIQRLTVQTDLITRKKNFDLEVSVETKDETAQLAMSIRQLVKWAGEYTDELELSQRTLEQRVQDRTKQLEAAQTTVIQSAKMSSLGQVVAGVAHEINNPVGFIYGNIQHTREYMDDLLEAVDIYCRSCPPEAISDTDAERIRELELPFLKEDAAKLLQSMESGANRIKDIVLSLRTFSRLDEADLKRVDLHEGIDSTLTILGSRLRLNNNTVPIEVVKNYGDLPLVYCQAGQLNQVFMNIITNAINALAREFTRGSGGTATVVATVANPKIVIVTKTEGDRCLISINNNGPIIPREVRDRMFDPFFTTKAVGKGTGMGLANSYQIVTNTHGGYLTCISERGIGTTFTIEIPTNGIVAGALPENYESA
ncbi:MAG: ATP-binding protein [Cyanobacteria bacterium P01_F01_bin.153]